ncbi:MAG: hypothetical protein ACOH2T_19145 [Pseudomonas sp.]
MKEGDLITCRADRGYAFTIGKKYVVLYYEPAGKARPDDAFIWPTYVQVLDDNGKKTYCHAHRFEEFKK